MVTFLVCLAILIGGYFIYGSYVYKQGALDENKLTPAVTMEDGIDYMPMPLHKVLLIQFLNIAGTGPIFGAILGAAFGPVAFLWITFGTIFAGAVHDFLSGVISMKHNGTSVSEIVGIYLGSSMKNIMRVFSVILLILVGTVFVTSPAGLLSNLTGLDKTLLVGIIIIYYILATILPVDKIIGKIYPLFGVCLILMAVGLCGGMFIDHFNGTTKMVELTKETFATNLHPDGLNVFPFLFVTIACGALSGFHATQSPMMARCVRKPKEAKAVFYGAMVVEGIVALIWCAVTITFFRTTEGVKEALTTYNGAAGVVGFLSKELLGTFGSVLAVLGVVACPITSGDTAFRSIRLTIADAFKIDQKNIAKRFIIAIPLFIICILLTMVNFDIIWRYFAWSNQTLATIFLWTSAVYLYKANKNYFIVVIPATIMSYVCTSYIMQAKEGFKLPSTISNIAGIIVAIALFALFMVKKSGIKKEEIN
ncbi:carbon starvation protein A [uncultured Tyzzerella sp.]|uniref:carbon starvation CstA family protein n=1 Tax=uncultured Tyzzerella sp. TaxID=2321398 RepID=UPI002941CFEE|nr:carbon starvation protein A [uncultured Tyzzerella sp.]